MLCGISCRLEERAAGLPETKKITLGLAFAATLATAVLLLHGLVFCGLFALALPRLARKWRLWLAVTLEAVWEVFENSAFVINRYRAATVSLGYQGDSIVNSLGDIAACALGFALAWRLGWRRSAVVFLVTEAVLLLWIRDSLLLNVVMLIYPIEAIKIWQLGH